MNVNDRRYIATKIVMAREEAKFDAGTGKSVPGYHVTYSDGYESWCPKDAFEAANRLADGMPFWLALEAMKQGHRVTRAGWNGKGQWIMLTITPPTTSIEVAGDRYAFAPYVQLKNAQGEMVPWQPSQGDMLADDWAILD